MSELITDPTRRVTAKEMYINTLEGFLALGSVNAGDYVGAVISATIVPPQLYLANFTMEIRVDTDDAAHQYPNGSSLTAEQRNSVVTFQYGDSGNSAVPAFTDDDAGIRAWVVQINNFGTVAHTYFLRTKIYGLFGTYSA